jgi:L-ascorbate metabolism protein UlaG (beta-lactamase superfamily)
MGPEDAVTAAEFIQAGLVVPMHYNTFGLINQDAGAFVAALAAKGMKGEAVEIGGEITV